MAWGERTIWVGFDDREAIPYAVARHSIRMWSNGIPVYGIDVDDLQARGWYKRPIEHRTTAEGKEQLWDPISDAPMSTKFACSRFCVLELARRAFYADRGWALFVDCDVIARAPLEDLFWRAERSPEKALFCVPHNHVVADGATKKDGVAQVNYSRKNQSSLMLLNLGHRANDALTLDLINTAAGRDLHNFCWLDERDIGYLDFRWNHLVGVAGSTSPDPAIVHFTNGGPWLPQYADCEYAGEWRAAYHRWVRG